MTILYFKNFVMVKPVYNRGKGRGGTGIGVGGDKGINAYPIPVSKTAQQRIPEGFSLLDFLNIDSTTYVRTIIDDSGSMDTSIPQINIAIDDLEELLKTNIWNGNQAQFNKYFDRIYRSNEHWVEWVAEDLRDSPSEPDKTVFLIWQNEADDKYHVGNDGSATSFLNSHISNFINVYNTRKDFFKCLVFGINTSGNSEGFQDHLSNVRFGQNGVNNKLTPINYGVNIFKDIDPNTESKFYYDAMVGKIAPI